MKAILPILICSAISAALGYYFGHITVPADLTTSKPAPASSNGGAATTSTKPSNAPVAEKSADPFPMPVEEQDEPAVEPTEPIEPAEPEEQAEADTTAAPAETDFAERAAKSIHTLTDTQGRTINAKIIKVLDTEVKIRRSDGLETTIPLNMLSDKDTAFCNYLREQQEAEEVKTPDTSDGFDWDAYFNS